MQKDEFNKFVKEVYILRLSGMEIKKILDEKINEYKKLDSDQIAYLNFNEFLFKNYRLILTAAVKDNDIAAIKVISMLSEAWIDGKTYYEYSDNVKVRIELRRDDLDKMLKIFHDNGMTPYLTEEETLH